MSIVPAPRLHGFRTRWPAAYALAKAAYFRLLQLPSFLKWKRLPGQTTVLLELGSGPKRGANGWTTVDRHGADINWDLRKGLPLPDGSVDGIYSSHLLEHIPYLQLQQFINECARTLKPGGTFSVCVPNAGLYLNAYAAQSVYLPQRPKFTPAVCDTGSFIDQVNYIAYMGGEHCNMFDAESLIKILVACHFARVERRNFDPTIDREDRDFESIYAVAWK